MDSLLLPFTYAAFTLQPCCGGRSCKGRRLNRETCDFHTHSPHTIIFEKFFLRLCQRFYKLIHPMAEYENCWFSAAFFFLNWHYDWYFELRYSVDNIFITYCITFLSSVIHVNCQSLLLTFQRLPPLVQRSGMRLDMGVDKRKESLSLYSVDLDILPLCHAPF